MLPPAQADESRQSIWQFVKQTLRGKGAWIFHCRVNSKLSQQSTLSEIKAWSWQGPLQRPKTESQHPLSGN